MTILELLAIDGVTSDSSFKKTVDLTQVTLYRRSEKNETPITIKLDLSPPNIISTTNKIHKEIIEIISYLHFPQTNKEKVNIIIQNIAI